MPQFKPQAGLTGLVWRYDTRQDVEHAVQQIGELGFQGTEFWSQIYHDFGDDSAAFRTLLDRNGVTLAALFRSGPGPIARRRTTSRKPGAVWPGPSPISEAAS